MQAALLQPGAQSCGNLPQSSLGCNTMRRVLRCFRGAEGGENGVAPMAIEDAPTDGEAAPPADEQVQVSTHLMCFSAVLFM